MARQESGLHPLGRRRPFAAIRPALLATLAVGAGCAVAAAPAAGAPGLRAAIIATVLVAVFFASGALPVLLARYLPPSGLAGAGALIVTYSLRLALIFIVLGVLTSVDGIDHRWLGLSLMACALVYTLTHAVLLFRENGRQTSGPVRTAGPE